jgi:hypothetical protein
MGLSRDIVSVIDPYSCKFCTIVVVYVVRRQIGFIVSDVTCRFPVSLI